MAAAKRAGDGGSGRSHAIVGEARLAGSDQPVVTLMSEVLTQRATLVNGNLQENFTRTSVYIVIGIFGKPGLTRGLSVGHKNRLHLDHIM